MDVVILKDSVTSNLTDEEFFRLCAENPDLRIERNSNLEISIMSPVNSKFSYYSGAVFGQLYMWNQQSRLGYAFDSSAGFTLADRSVLSPDASWISRDRWKALTQEQQNQFAPIAPDLIIEVRSPSDSFESLRKKLAVWIQNGVQQAWLIDPITKKSHILLPSSELITEPFSTKLLARHPLEGFVFDPLALEL